MSGSDEQTVRYAKRLFDSLIRGRTTDSVIEIGRALRADIGSHPPVTAATAVSGLEQALWDLHAKLVGCPVYELLGQRQRSQIALYANINRGIQNDRSPENFAKRARAAVENGFKEIKCAPFDDVLPGTNGDAVHTGIDRVFAVREAIGNHIQLMVDCHGRFDAATAAWAAKTLEPVNLHWLEEPLASHMDMHVLAGVKNGANNEPAAENDVIIHTGSTAHLANLIAIPLAGGEFFYGIAQFERILNEANLTYLMPDVKHCGGISEMLDIADKANKRGVAVTPHNPTGPVATLASAHVCAILPNFHTLEYQWGEIPERSVFVQPPEQITGGLLNIPDGPGFGLELNIDVLNEYRIDLNSG
jgi:galactonate dehydratase